MLISFVCTLATCQQSAISYAEVTMYLKSKVLEEVSCAIGFVGLCPTAGINPDANGGSLSPW